MPVYKSKPLKVDLDRVRILLPVLEEDDNKLKCVLLGRIFLLEKRHFDRMYEKVDILIN